MTNRQWLMKEMQNMSDEEFAIVVNGGAVGVCNGDRCKKNAERTCITCKKDWLKSEHKEQIKLSDAERTILENMNEKFEWIARDMAGSFLYVYEEKPQRGDGSWESRQRSATPHNFMAFDELFQFIKWEDTEPYNIEELLKNEDRN